MHSRAQWPVGKSREISAEDAVPINCEMIDLQCTPSHGPPGLQHAQGTEWLSTRHQAERGPDITSSGY